MKEYKINIGLSEEDISEMQNGATKFHFLPTNDTDYNEKISISIGKVEDDAPLSDCMDLVVEESQDLGLTGLS